MNGTKVFLGVRISPLARALIALERKTNGGSDGKAVERLIVGGSTSPEAIELISKAIKENPDQAALVAAIRKKK